MREGVGEEAGYEPVGLDDPGEEDTDRVLWTQDAQSFAMGLPILPGLSALRLFLSFVADDHNLLRPAYRLLLEAFFLFL